jgi:ferredoxin
MTEPNDMSCCDMSSTVKNLLSVLDLRIMIDHSKCKGCGLCNEICPFGLPQKGDSGAYEITLAEKCIECSACQRNCPENAIIMNEQKGCGCLWNARERAKGEKSTKKCC